MSSLERVRADQIVIAPDARYTAMQQAGIMVQIIPLADTVVNRLSIVQITWQFRLALLPLNICYRWPRLTYPLHPVYIPTTSMRTIHESWDPLSRRMQHNNLASSSLNHWNAVTVDVNVNLGHALAKKIVADAVSDALVPKTPRAIQI